MARHPLEWHALIRRLRAIPDVTDPNARQAVPGAQALWDELEDRVRRVADTSGIKSLLFPDEQENVRRAIVIRLVSPLAGDDQPEADQAPEADRDFASDQEFERNFGATQQPGGDEPQGEREGERPIADEAYVRRVRKMLRHAALDVRRANPESLRRLIGRPVLLSEADASDQPIDDARFKSRYRRLLRKDRALVDLALTKGLSIAEIAGRTGLRPSQVTLQLFRLFRRLRE